MTAAPPTTSRSDRRKLMVGKGWVQAVALVVIFGFFVMGILAYRTYTASMPQPEKVVTANGEVLFTGADITAGQELFLARGLMEYGSVVGHGAYLGPDYTADYLRRATDFVETQLRESGTAEPRQAVISEFRTNRYDEATGTLTFTDNQARAFEANTQHYGQFFGADSSRNGLVPNVISDPAQVRQLTAFFAWTAWASAAERPGHNYSYTNNWPAEPRVDNSPTADVVVWSVLSLVVLLGGTGILFAVYGRWSAKVGWHSAEAPAISFRRPSEVALTPAQRATAWFFFTIAALFLVQTLLGAAAEHYRADILSFFGFDLAALLPFNLARTWHLQLALFWTAASFLAAGIFLTPFIAGREPRKQAVLVYVLFGAVVVVVVGSLLSEALSIHGVSLGEGAPVRPAVGVPRPAAHLAGPADVGMFLWIAIIYRGIRSRLAVESRGQPALAVLLLRPVDSGVLRDRAADRHRHPPSPSRDFWRFWVVHLWVEDFLELFTTMLVAYIFVLLGIVSRDGSPLGVIYFDVMLYSVGGVVGTMHHLYFSGTPVEHMALGAFFSAAEVIPLTFLTVEAWAFLQLGARQESGRWAGRSRTAGP